MLEHLFGSNTRLQLLRIFYGHPDRAFFVRELTRLAEIQLNAVRRELANLENLGIIEQVEAGHSKEEEVGTERSKYYRLKPDYYLFDELHSLLNKTQVLEEKNFLEILRKKAGDLKLMILTGFFTSASEVDTDILLVGDLKQVTVAKVIKDFEKFLNRSIRYTLMTKKEFTERKEIGDKFLYSIFEAKHNLVVDEIGIN